MLELRKGPPAATILQALKSLEQKWKRPVLIVETGGILEDTLNCLLVDGHYPTFLTSYIKSAKYNHAFYCITPNASLTKSMLTSKNLAGFVSIMEENPLETFKTFFLPPIKIGMAILDSSTDPNEALEEFKAIEDRIEEGGIVFIDDVDPDNKVTQKGQLLVTYLQEQARRGFQFDNGMLKVFF